MCVQQNALNLYKIHVSIYVKINVVHVATVLQYVHVVLLHLIIQQHKSVNLTCNTYQI